MMQLNIIICLVATTSFVILAINYERLGLLNVPILLVGNRKQQDFTRSRGAPQTSPPVKWHVRFIQH